MLLTVRDSQILGTASSFALQFLLILEWNWNFCIMFICLLHWKIRAQVTFRCLYKHFILKNLLAFIISFKSAITIEVLEDQLSLLTLLWFWYFGTVSDFAFQCLLIWGEFQISILFLFSFYIEGFLCAVHWKFVHGWLSDVFINVLYWRIYWL